MASYMGIRNAILTAVKVTRKKFPEVERDYARDELFLREALYALSKSGERTEHIGRFDAEDGSLAIECDERGYFHIDLDPALDGKRLRVTVEVLAEDDPA